MRRFSDWMVRQAVEGGASGSQGAGDGGQGSGEGAGAGQGDGGNGGGQGAGSGGVTFTAEQQAHLNTLLANERRDTERRVKESDELKQLRAKAKAHDDAQAAQQTETEKLTKRATDAETLADERAAKYRGALIKADFTAKATAAGIPADRIEAAFKLADLAAVTVDEEKDVVSGVDAVITALPAWLKTPEGKAAPDTNNNGGSGGLTKEQALAAEIERQKATGRY